MTDTKKCKVAIVGAGYMAKEHIQAFQDIEEVEVVGITSRTLSKAHSLAKELSIPNVFDSISAMHKQTGANLVVVTVPELFANEVSRECFEFPWAVLLEKPAGYNIEDAASILSVATEKNANVFVALNRRQYSSTKAVLKDIRDVGGTRWIHVQDQQDQKTAFESGQPQTVVDFWMYANSVHLIDYFKMFGRGEITSVEQVIPWNPKAPGIVAAKITFESGDVGFYEGIWNGPGPWAISVSTPDKRWEMRPLEEATCQKTGERMRVPMQLHEWDKQFKPGLRLQAQEATKAAMGMKADLPSLQEAFESMLLVNSIFGV